MYAMMNMNKYKRYKEEEKNFNENSHEITVFYDHGSYLPITDAESLTTGGASVTAFNAAPPRILLKDARLLVVVANGRNPW